MIHVIVNTLVYCGSAVS